MLPPAEISFVLPIGDTYHFTPLRQSDDSTRIRLLNAPPLTHRLISPPYPYEASHAVEFYDMVVTNATAQTVWAIRTSDHDYIGQVSLDPIILPTGSNDSTQFAQCFVLGYFIDTAYSGKGIMTAAVKALLNAFDIDGSQDIVQAWVETGNIASETVVAKCGFNRVEGEIGTRVDRWPESKGGRSAEMKLWQLNLTKSGVGAVITSGVRRSAQ